MTTDQTVHFIASACSMAIAAIGQGDEPLRIIDALTNKLQQLSIAISHEGREAQP